VAMAKYLITTKGSRILVDDDVYEFFKDKRVDETPDGYAIVRLHQMFHPKGHVIDHVNRDKTDNRRENLRPTCRLGNAVNSRPSTWTKKKSRFKGVVLDPHSGKSKPWCIRITPRVVGHPTARHRLFYKGFATEEEAARAYDMCALFLWGPHAYTNFDRSNYECIDLALAVEEYRVGSPKKSNRPTNIKPPAGVPYTGL
jgi:hypothetical protein